MNFFLVIDSAVADIGSFAAQTHPTLSWIMNLYLLLLEYEGRSRPICDYFQSLSSSYLQKNEIVDVALELKYCCW